MPRWPSVLRLEREVSEAVGSPLPKVRTVRLWARDENDRQPKVVGGERPEAWDRSGPSGILYDLEVPDDVRQRRNVLRCFAFAKRLMDLGESGKSIADVAKNDPQLAVELMKAGTLKVVARG